MFAQISFFFFDKRRTLNNSSRIKYEPGLSILLLNRLQHLHARENLPGFRLVPALSLAGRPEYLFERLSNACPRHRPGFLPITVRSRGLYQDYLVCPPLTVRQRKGSACASNKPARAAVCKWLIDNGRFSASAIALANDAPRRGAHSPPLVGTASFSCHHQTTPVRFVYNMDNVF